MRHVEQRPALLDEVINVRQHTGQPVRKFYRDRDGMRWVSDVSGKVRFIGEKGDPLGVDSEYWNLASAINGWGLRPE